MDFISSISRIVDTCSERNHVSQVQGAFNSNRTVNRFERFMDLGGENALFFVHIKWSVNTSLRDQKQQEKYVINFTKGQQTKNTLTWTSSGLP